MSIELVMLVLLVVKNPPTSAGDVRDTDSIPGWEDPLEEGMQPTPVFSLRESHGQLSQESCRPWGHKESGTTEAR